MEPDWSFPMPMTIRCYKCGKVYEVAFTSEERHEFHCPACGEIEVYNLGAMREKAAAAEAKKIRKSGGGGQI
jgi:phage FluMu protein Com